MPKAKNLPDGETYKVINLNGKSIYSTGSATSQSQNYIGIFIPHVTILYIFFKKNYLILIPYLFFMS